MNTTVLKLVACCLLLIAVNPGYAQIQLTDDNGRQIALEQPARRIVSLAPSLTELLFAAGAGSQIVGVVEYSDYPPAALGIPVVGRHDLLNLERIVSLQPDLVVAWRTGNPQGAIRQLINLGMHVYIAEPKSLQDVAQQLVRLGILAGTLTTATRASDDFLATLVKLQDRFGNEPPVDVFYQVWDSPLITAGGNELLNDIISVCGGNNVFADMQLMAPKIDLEAVLARDPEIIIASGMDQARPEWLDDWRQWHSLRAVRNNHLYFIAPDLLQRHTPRALQGASLMCEQIQSARASRD